MIFYYKNMLAKMRNSASDGCNARSDVGLNLVIETELERGQEFAVTPLQLCISRFLLLYIYLDHRIAISVDVG